MARYANETTVAVAKSRGDIDALLRDWGCDGIRWTDHFTDGIVRLEFVWNHDGADYGARFSLRLPDDAALRAEAVHATSGRFLQSKFDKLASGRGRQEHRVLLLWLKASFNAVEAGIVSAETLFLPFLVDANGQTVAEVALPRLHQMLSGGAESLLGIGAGSAVD